MAETLLYPSLIHGFLLKANDPSVRLIFNPLQKFTHGKTVGDYDELTNTITFSIRGLWDKDMNFDNLLRHEMTPVILNNGHYRLFELTLPVIPRDGITD